MSIFLFKNENTKYRVWYEHQFLRKDETFSNEQKVLVQREKFT